jgi:hypothetical protein
MGTGFRHLKCLAFSSGELNPGLTLNVGLESESGINYFFFPPFAPPALVPLDAGAAAVLPPFPTSFLTIALSLN